MHYTFQSHKHHPETADAPHTKNDDFTVYILGKAYSIETLKCRDWCTSRGIAHHFVDIELDENADYWFCWIKARHILSIPVVILNNHYIVGFDEQALNKLIHSLIKEYKDSNSIE